MKLVVVILVVGMLLVGGVCIWGINSEEDLGSGIYITPEDTRTTIYEKNDSGIWIKQPFGKTSEIIIGSNN